MDTIFLKVTILSIAMFLISNVCFSQYKTNITITDVGNKSLTAKMQENATNLLTEFNLAYFNNTKPKIDNSILTANAAKSILSLWETSMFRCYETDIIEKGIQNKGDYEVRNIPLYFKEATEGENYEEAVLLFNTYGFIDDIYISVGTNRVNEILRSSNSVTDFRRRQIIVDFIENFRTAYNKKDVDFLNKVYSDDALIISGKVIKIKETNIDLMQKNFSAEKIIYQKQTKSEYINKLKQIFKNNNYINIKFDEIEVVKNDKYPNYYGVTLKQHWNTSNYNDIGYLFLLIDFQNEESPLIHVRTWQPEKYNGRELTKDEIFNIGSFGKLR